MSTITLNVDFDLDVTDFDETDVTISHTIPSGSVTFDSIVINNSSSYTITYTIDEGDNSGGIVTFQILADQCLSLDGAGNKISQEFEIIVPEGSSDTQPIPTISLLDEFYDIGQMQFRVSFDQDVTGFDVLDISVDESGLPGTMGSNIALFTANSASEYDFVWEANDDGSGGDVDFFINAAVCTGTVGGLDNVASAVFNQIVMGF